jgi:hypothetical protein
MRWAPLLLLVLSAGCGLPLTGAGTGGTSTGGTSTAGGGACAKANPNNCADCQTCADNGPCASLLTACNDDPNCADVLACAAGCGGDATCLQTNCYSANPGGQAGFQALANCRYCDQCPCSGFCG